jgi:triphosphoribosyl-dephospho-CoA synthase
MVARQYCNGFQQAQEVAAQLDQLLREELSVSQAIVHTHVWMMSEYPDSLIARKRGAAVAKESASRAGHVLAGGDPQGDTYQSRLADLDFWLRSDGHARNPGTTADLVAAGIFIALRDDKIHPPLRLGPTST